MRAFKPSPSFNQPKKLSNDTRLALFKNKFFDYNENLSLDDLANKFFISKYHLSREFQRLVGTSVHRYIVQKRLVMAKQMLSSGKPSSEVYQNCGFGDYSNFYRAFKAEYQISPKDYVLRLKENAYREDPLPKRFRERSEK